MKAMVKVEMVPDVKARLKNRWIVQVRGISFTSIVARNLPHSEATRLLVPVRAGVLAGIGWMQQKAMNLIDECAVDVSAAFHGEP